MTFRRPSSDLRTPRSRLRDVRWSRVDGFEERSTPTEVSLRFFLAGYVYVLTLVLAGDTDSIMSARGEDEPEDEKRPALPATSPAAEVRLGKAP